MQSCKQYLSPQEFPIKTIADHIAEGRERARQESIIIAAKVAADEAAKASMED